MQTREWNFIDKSTWPRGQWDTEPDKIQWQDETTKLPCLIVRNKRTGILCGYVGVGKQHKNYEAEYDQVEQIDVHGGLTFSGKCDDNEHGICHVVEIGDDDNVWWLGFDCAHGGDLSPTDGFSVYETYRDVEYVQQQCQELAKQLASVLADSRDVR